MLRLIRRAPWIALGAAGAYYLDGDRGPRRRRTTVARVREWLERYGGQWQAYRDTGDVGTDEPADDVPLVPSVPADRVRTRSAEPLAEEQAAGVPVAASRVMARQILEESEVRVTHREATAGEHRRSEDTVAPPGAA